MPVRPVQLIPTIRSAPHAARALSPEEIQELRKLPYEKYLLTRWWRERRNQALRGASYRCHRCAYKRELQVHHLTYERIGCELADDLEVVCRGCHVGEHRNQVDDHVGVYKRLLSEVIAEGGREYVSDVIEEVKARCVKKRIPIDHVDLHAAVARLLPRFPFSPPKGKEELYHQGAAHEPLSRAEAAGILSRLQAAGLMKHMPNVRPFTVREMECRRALKIVAQAITEQVQRCEDVEAGSATLPDPPQRGIE